MAKYELAAGVVIGIGIKWLSPYLLPVLGALVSPVARLEVKRLAKSSVKAGWLALERGRELLVQWGETVQDVLAEAREELVREDETRVGP